MSHPHRLRALCMLPAPLAAAGLVGLSLSAGHGGWVLVIVWLFAAGAAGVVWAGFTARSTRVALATAMSVATVVLTWEGGLFFVPAAIAMLIVSITASTRSRPRARSLERVDADSRAGA